jgi:hypothetical protein
MGLGALNLAARLSDQQTAITSQGSSVPMRTFKLSALLNSGYCAFAAFLVVGTVSLSSSAAPLQLPTWPQKFDIGGPEAATFGFIVTQPGPVAIDIQTNGAPVVATLQGAVPRAAEQGGSGTLHLAYQVTPQNLQVSALWTVRIMLVPAAAAAGARAGGTIVVHAAPVDPAAAQAQLAKANAQAQSSRQAMEQRRRDPQAAAARAAEMDAVLNGRRAQYDQQRQQVRAQMHAQLQPLAAAAQMRVANQVGTRGIAPQSSARVTAAPSTGVLAKVPPTGSSSQPIVGASSGPSPQTVANPIINSLSVAQGQPGDPVVITGAGFATGGEVHFIINPGQDVVAHVDIWSDTQVFAEVPDASGILGFNGQAYVIRAGDKVHSNFVPFHFNPGVEFRDLRSTMDRALQNPVMDSPANEILRYNDNPFTGFQNNDVLFASAQLKNGWVVEDAFVYCEYSRQGYNMCFGGAYPLIVPRGSSSLATTVHWWIETAPYGSGSSFLDYTFAVRIMGPKGVPDGVAVP